MTISVGQKTKMKFLKQEEQRERETDGNKRCDEKHEGDQEIFHLHLGPEERKPQEGEALIKADELL